MLLFHSLCCRRLCVSSFGAFPVFPFSRSIPAFYTKILCCLGLYAQYRSWCTVGGGRWGGGSLGCIGGILGLVRVFIRECSLTCQPDYQLCIPARLLFPQGTGEPSSAYHPLIGPRNGDCDLTIYPPSYLQKGFFPFLRHELTQLR